jgi:tRNA(fMet)-specific endonuclease VapC
LNYLLDTNIIIFFFRGKFDLHHKIKHIGIERCFISEITLAELKYGAAYSQNPLKHFEKIDKLLESITVIPISSIIDLFANQKANLRKLGTMIDDFDLLIGCTAIQNEMILVTNNTKHFERLNNIQLEDWTKSNSY